MTRNVPGKVPITERSEKPTSTVNTAVLWRSSPRAKQPFVCFIFGGYLRTVTAEGQNKHLCEEEKVVWPLSFVKVSSVTNANSEGS